MEWSVLGGLETSERVSRFLDAFFSKDISSVSKYAKCVVEMFEDVARYVVSDEEDHRVVAYANGSYIHANGFKKLILFCTDCGKYRLRIHVWDEVALNYRSLNIHDHRYSFASYVRRGAMENVSWKLGTEGIAHRKFVYSSSGFGDRYSMSFVGIEGLEISNTISLKAGDIYAVSSEDLHFSRPIGEDRVVTFFLENRSKRKELATVYSLHHSVEEHSVDTDPIPINKYKQLIFESIYLL